MCTQDNLPDQRIGLAPAECHTERHQITGDLVTPPSHPNLDYARNDAETTDGELRLDMDLGTLGRESALAGEDVSLAQGMRDVDEIAETVDIQAEP